MRRMCPDPGSSQMTLLGKHRKLNPKEEGEVASSRNRCTGGGPWVWATLLVWGRGPGGLCLERALRGSVWDRSEGKEARKEQRRETKLERKAYYGLGERKAASWRRCHCEKKLHV